jgi:hypothetical protein
MLRKTNVKLLRAKTGDEAIKLFHENNPDIILGGNRAFHL